jgi:hypothetical protein
MNPSRYVLIFAVFFIAIEVGIAHHSFAAVYDGSRVMTINGVVTKFRFVNPHTMLYVDVADSAGKFTSWTIEFAGVLNLSESGWNRDSLKVGEHVFATCVGFPVTVNRGCFSPNS